MTEPKRLDEGHLLALTGGDADLRQEILQSFIRSARENMNALRAAASGDAWRRAAHKLKGLAASVGAQKLAAQAQVATTGQVDLQLLALMEDELAALAQLVPEQGADG